MRKRSPLKYFKTSPEIIRLVLMLYVRLPLSPCTVEDLLHERGVDVSHETVRFWWHRFRRMIASEIRKRRMRSLQMFAAVNASAQHHFNRERCQSSNPLFMANRAAAHAEWRGLCAGLRDSVLARFTEVESGGWTDRLELAKTLKLARLPGSTLVIANLDRLSRNAAFLPTLRDSGVLFLARDMPEANDLTVRIMALIAEQKRAAIARRTKEALAAARAVGVKLGNPNGAAARRRAGKGGVALRNAVSANADEFARSLAQAIVESQAAGKTSPRAMAAELNDWGIETRRGRRWHVSNVRSLLSRLGDLPN